MQFISAGQSDVGCVRKRNEDSFLVDATAGFYVVADGMGGHMGGDVASRICVDTVHDFVSPAPTDSGDGKHFDMERLLKMAINRASQAIQDEARKRPFLYGMGTTVVLLKVDENNMATLAHAGDSRAYLITDEGCSRLTSDHTWVNEQVQAGLLTEQEGEASQYKNLLTRSVGFETMVQSDTCSRRIQPGDRFLLCSDGLTNVLSDHEISRYVAQETDPDNAASAMITLARKRGAPDNVTAVLVYAQGPKNSQS